MSETSERREGKNCKLKRPSMGGEPFSYTLKEYGRQKKTVHVRAEPGTKQLSTLYNSLRDTGWISQETFSLCFWFRAVQSRFLKKFQSFFFAFTMAGFLLVVFGVDFQIGPNNIFVGGHVVFGNHVYIGAGNRFGRNVHFNDAVRIVDGCWFGKNITVEDGCRFGTGVRIERNCVIGAGCRFMDGSRVPANTIVQPGTILGPGQVHP
jgi:hypothetical protein